MAKQYRSRWSVGTALTVALFGALAVAHAETVPSDTINLHRNTAVNMTGASTDPSQGRMQNGQPTRRLYFSEGKEVTPEKYQAAQLFNEALTAMRQNENEKAAEKFKLSLKYLPDYAEAHHNLGLTLAKLGDVNSAIDELNTAIKLKPDLDSSWLTLGGIHQSLGHIDDAIQTYNAFLEKFGKKHPMYTKINDLVTALKTEHQAMNAARNADAVLRPPQAGGNGTRGGAANNDDYLAEVTRSGVVRWPLTKMPIKVRIKPPVYELGGKPTGYKDDFKGILVQSFKDWSEVSEGRIKFEFTELKDTADLECTFIADPGELQHSGSSAEAGDAKIRSNTDGISTCEIRILTKPLTAALPLTNNRMRFICLHEIGHALGLNGHTDNPDDIMFYSVSFKDEWKNLSGRDARTIKRLYSPN